MQPLWASITKTEEARGGEMNYSDYWIHLLNLLETPVRFVIIIGLLLYGVKIIIDELRKIK